MLVAAALCPAPPLLARELTGADPVLPELRQACLDVTLAMLAADPGVVAVVGAADQAASWDERARLDVSGYAPALAAAQPDPPAPRLPSSIGLGAMLLDQAGFTGRRLLRSVTEDDEAADCGALGARLARAGTRVALLAMADGSARRGLKAPGYLDERSGGFDAEIERALLAGDMAALLAVDAALARDLMATGRPAWQVLAGSMAGRQPTAEVRYSDDPFGVFYLVALLLPG